MKLLSITALGTHNMKKISKTVKQRFDDLGKEHAQRLHFVTRLRERLGLRIDDNLYDHMCSCIKNDKTSEHFFLEYLYDQSNRLMVYKLIIRGKEPVNIIYDKSRKKIITVLFEEDEDKTEINFYYDVFMNKVSLKHDLGFNRGWALYDGVLNIPTETLIHSGKYSEVVSEGILYGKRFKLDNNTVYEVM